MKLRLLRPTRHSLALVSGDFLVPFAVAFTIIFFSVGLSAADRPNSFADLAEKLSPSVVNISTTTIVNGGPGAEMPQFPPGSPFEEFFKNFGENNRQRKAQSLGSGFIIDAKGIVVTNHHVIENAEEIRVILADETSFTAKVLGQDKKTDIAVLKIEPGDTKLAAVAFGDSDSLRVGDWVLAIGNPFGFGGSVTSGIISSRNRDIGLTRYDDFIQTDASINQGNSGGPLFDLNGKVIGINTAIIAPGSSGSIGIGFAIPSNSAKRVIDQLIKFGETKRGWLGVRIQVVTKEIAEIEKLDKPRGALVASVAEGSPSDKAGIKAGDIILEFNGVPINEMRELPKIVAETDVGKVVDVKVWRNQKEISKKITLGRLETSDDFKAQGKTEEKSKLASIEGLKISVRLLTERDIIERKLPKNTTGVVIVKIENDSPVNYLNINDVIVEAQRKKIRTIGQLDNIVKSTLKSNDKTLLIAIYNNQNQRRYIGVKLD